MLASAHHREVVGEEDWLWQLLELLAGMEAPRWHARAACLGVGAHIFFPEKAPGMRAAIATARALCAGCPVTEECRAAGEYQPVGIWAGETHGERVQRYRHPKTRRKKAA